MGDSNFDNIFQKHVKNSKDFFFIQIGSNDGKTGDPIHKYIIKYNWKGILVEPVGYIFKKLLKTYQDRSGLIFKNIAIAKEKGYRDFYRVRKNNQSDNPFWYDQLGSFKKEILLKHKKLVPNLNRYLIKERVKCITFDDLLDECKVKKIDLLHIDTEGYDFEIIKLIDFDKIFPKMVIYENKHLTKIDQTRCMDYLRGKGYSLIVCNKDTFAFLE